MDISLYTVILLTGLFIFFICVCADSSLLIFDVGCIVGFFMIVIPYAKLLSLMFSEIFDTEVWGSNPLRLSYFLPN